MTLRSEHRALRDGGCVNSWKECNSFLYGAYRVIRNRVEMFLDENPIYKKGSGCIFCEGFSPQNPPKIIVEFSKSGVVFDDWDSTKILTFMYKLTSWRGNLKFETNTGLSGQFRILLEIRIKSYRPFTDKQPEMDLFAPEPFGGGALPLPDPLHYLMRRHLLFEVPFFPPKDQRLFYLGAFTDCGNSTNSLSDIHPPKVRFSNLNPSERDDIPFEWPLSPEKSWQQLELPCATTIPVQYGRDEISAPKTTPFVSALRGLLRKIVGTLVGFWRRIFS